jgi:hypothetical protein
MVREILLRRTWRIALLLALPQCPAVAQQPAITQGSHISVQENGIDPVSGHYLFALSEQDAYIEFGARMDDQVWHNVGADRLTIASRKRTTAGGKTYARMVSTYVHAKKETPFVWDHKLGCWLVYQRGKPVKDPETVNKLIESGQIWIGKDTFLFTAEVEGEKLLTEVAKVPLVKIRAVRPLGKDNGVPYALELIAKTDKAADQRVFAPGKYPDAETRFEGGSTVLEGQPQGHFIGSIGFIVTSVTGEVNENCGDGAQIVGGGAK